MLDFESKSMIDNITKIEKLIEIINFRRENQIKTIILRPSRTEKFIYQRF